MSKTTITHEAQFQTPPAAIDTTKYLWDSFGHSETEISAGWLVRFAQARGRGWAPFTYGEIHDYYTAPGRRPAGETFLFNRLLPQGFIVGPGDQEFNFNKDDKFYYTAEFVGKCLASSPALVPQPSNKAPTSWERISNGD